MLSLRLKTTALTGAVTFLLTSQVSANIPIWESLWLPVHPAPAPYQGSAQSISGYGVPVEPYQEFFGSGVIVEPQYPQVQFQRASYSNRSVSDELTHQGLANLETLLERKSAWQSVNLLGSTIRYRELLNTVQHLNRWNRSLQPEDLSQHFELKRINTPGAWGKGKFTGYYTPILRASYQRTAVYRYPVYRKPASDWLRRLDSREIAKGRLADKGLEIAWVADPYELYVAQVQGAGILEFADGTRKTIDYADSNDKAFHPVSSYLDKNGYKPQRLTHSGIKHWLQTHNKMEEALLSNPRYVFFRDTGNAPPQTASGLPAIPGHTVAVDSTHIPHGSVLLAELPVLDSLGKRTGQNEWRLLFAQDHGHAIKGNGRFDIYTGVGQVAESKTYSFSGDYRTFLLVKK